MYMGRTLPGGGRGFIERAGSKQLLRVVSEGQKVVLVITVIATSKFEKYGVTP
jgi:hypothetical protein